MITSYEFPNQWNWRIFLVICDDNELINDVLIHLKENESCIVNDEDVITDVDAPCFICNPNDLIRSNMY